MISFTKPFSSLAFCLDSHADLSSRPPCEHQYLRDRLLYRRHEHPVRIPNRKRGHDRGVCDEQVVRPKHLDIAVHDGIGRAGTNLGGTDPMVGVHGGLVVGVNCERKSRRSQWRGG